MPKFGSVVALLFSSLLHGCAVPAPGEPFALVGVDTITHGAGRYPAAVDPTLVGTYPAVAKSGAGHFYDEVLEHRVWMHPDNRAAPLAGDRDYYQAFADYERAATFAAGTVGAEEPLVLVRQREWINEPSLGILEVRTDERIAEWQVGWLFESKREPNSISDFLAMRDGQIRRPGSSRAPNSWDR